MRGNFWKGYVGNSEFGGWRDRGWQQFNELREDSRQDPKAQNIEAYLLQVICEEANHVKTVPAIESDNESYNGLLNGAPTIQAYCEL